MKTIADQLPPEIANQIHPDRRKNEAAYWAARDRLIDQYRGQWIGFAGGKVIASGSSPVTVFHAAEATGLHPFFICVGKENEPSRIRRLTCPYDASYAGEALPVVRVEFRQASGSAGLIFDRVIPDTGADASVLPWADCQTLKLSPSSGVQGLISGVVGSSAATLVFGVWVWLDGREYPCRLQVDFVGNERILGRDVLNQLEILFRGPAAEVVVNP
ncbi:MAG TPA: hypothetical protein VK797_19485 [Tepidisphaeraceae bacterium]|jgi:hypothetical protein|nr:hypothetical protein [Tepidisphaeraceae bacterium]